jgi:hypothetical protein
LIEEHNSLNNAHCFIRLQLSNEASVFPEKF